MTAAGRSTEHTERTEPDAATSMCEASGSVGSVNSVDRSGGGGAPYVARSSPMQARSGSSGDD